ncbi:MAG: hypothetical protein BGO13_06105 [Burkholderiales bacterium 66-5]|uniref:TMEM175 family protein n=1 Tax=Comamonas badia TaxID=265291 RepID=UPI0004011B56|nr:TMEM175 family protein [Comamonas badia]OJU89757.1 MAG: hypothetical protein BGO13_06105 [Burkholderiales bacterium 66-5]
MHTAATLASDPEPGPERIHALCDGMVSIALTVLALEIRFPEGPRGPLRTLLGQMLPGVLAFLLSFVVISGFWLAHHRLTRRVRHTSRGYNLANIGFMLALVSLNFPTAALAHYGDGDALAVVLYAAVVGATGVMLLLIVGTAQRQNLFGSALGAQEYRQALGVVLWPTAVFLLSIPLALLHPTAAMFAWMLAALAPTVRRLLVRG